MRAIVSATKRVVKLAINLAVLPVLLQQIAALLRELSKVTAIYAV